MQSPVQALNIFESASSSLILLPPPYFKVPISQINDTLLTTFNRMGSPKDLFGAKGTFYDMVQHSGEVKELQGIFGDSE